MLDSGPNIRYSYDCTAPGSNKTCPRAFFYARTNRKRGTSMKIIKRNGSEATFDLVKIIAAVTKANNVVAEDARMTPVQIQRIAESVEFSCQSLGRAPTVEEIQDFVEHQIMAHGAFEVAKRYITYRYNRSLVRKSNTTDDKILTLIECNNEEAKQENSNKNPTVNSVQRDYMAGDLISGNSRIAEAMLFATSIAIGLAFSLLVWYHWGWKLWA